jgi:hypothetical protein
MNGQNLNRQSPGRPIAAKTINRTAAVVESLTRMGPGAGIGVMSTPAGRQYYPTTPRLNIMQATVGDEGITAATVSQIGEGKITFRRRNPATGTFYDLKYGVKAFSEFTLAIKPGSPILTLQIFDEWWVVQVFACESFI